MIKLFTHTDLDGVGCAILAKLAFGNKVDISFCNYNEINIEVEKFFVDYNPATEYVCNITDISISEELAKKIDDSKKSYYLLDHHPTALYLNRYKWCTVRIENDDNIKTCGTELYYEHLLNYTSLESNRAMERFVNIVRDYDTWRWSTLGEEGIISKQINDLLYLYGREKFIEWCIEKINDNSFPELGETEKLLLEIRQREIDEYIDNKSKHLYRITISGLICGVVFAEKYVSELGNRLCKMYPEIDFIAMINMDGTVGFRTTRDNLNLGLLAAELFNGGGHPQAAGSQFSEEIVDKVIKLIFESYPYYN